MQPLENQTNVFGDPLESCSMDPLTGFFRTGCCDADSEDIGKHFVCARVDDAFLQYSLSQGNDLINSATRVWLRWSKIRGPMVRLRKSLVGGFQFWLCAIGGVDLYQCKGSGTY